MSSNERDKDSDLEEVSLYVCRLRHHATVDHAIVLPWSPLQFSDGL